jgi:hypothetical protein
LGTGSIAQVQRALTENSSLRKTAEERCFAKQYAVKFSWKSIVASEFFCCAEWNLDWDLPRLLSKALDLWDCNLYIFCSVCTGPGLSFGTKAMYTMITVVDGPAL